VKDVVAAVPVDGGRVSVGGDVGGLGQPAGKKAQDSRVGRRAGLRPGRAVTQNVEVVCNAQRTCRGRVQHDVHRRLPVSTFQLRGHRHTTSVSSLLLRTHSIPSPAELPTLPYAW